MQAFEPIDVCFIDDYDEGAREVMVGSGSHTRADERTRHHDVEQHQVARRDASHRALQAVEPHEISSREARSQQANDR